MTDGTRRADATRRSRGTRRLCDRRRSLLAAVGVTLSTAGCLGDPLGGWHDSDDSNPDHAVYLRNDAGETRTVETRVVRVETGETVFGTTREVAPGTDTEVYNTREADPEGVETFRVCAELVAPAEPTGEAGVTATTTDAGLTATADAISTATADAKSTTTDSTRHGCTTIRTDGCYGSVEIVVTEEGELQTYYSIC